MNDRLDVGVGGLLSETEVLLACLRADAAVPGDLLARLSTADWSAVIEQAIRLGVAPLLWHRLKALGPGMPVPAEAQAELAQAYYYGAAQNVRLYYDLGQVLGALRAEQIPVIVLKGAHLAQAVYPAIELRPMGDVDLLVRESDLARVERGLLLLGCAPDAPPGGERERASQAELNAHHSYRMAGRGLPIEVHWDVRLVQSPFTFEIDDLWERARPATIADVPVSVLSPEDLVLHLCLHAAFRHTFELGLKPLVDLCYVIRHDRGELDWQVLQARARQWGAGRCVYVTLYLAQKLLGAAVPEDVLRGLAPREGDTRFVAWAERQVLGAIDPVAGPLSNGWGRLVAADRFWTKVAVLFQTVFPSPRFLAAKYALPAGSRRVYLYYPIFLKDLLRRHAARAWRLWRGDETTAAWAEHEAQKAKVKDWLVGRVDKL